jgi:hypothetical protein
MKTEKRNFRPDEMLFSLVDTESGCAVFIAPKKLFNGRTLVEVRVDAVFDSAVLEGFGIIPVSPVPSIYALADDRVKVASALIDAGFGCTDAFSRYIKEVVSDSAAMAAVTQIVSDARRINGSPAGDPDAEPGLSMFHVLIMTDDGCVAPTIMVTARDQGVALFKAQPAIAAIARARGFEAEGANLLIIRVDPDDVVIIN